MEHYTVTANKDGRFQIPVKLRKEIGLEEGGEYVIAAKDGILQFMTQEQHIQNVLDSIHAAIPLEIQERIAKGDYMSDELIRERREEARKEAEELGDTE